MNEVAQNILAKFLRAFNMEICIRISTVEEQSRVHIISNIKQDEEPRPAW